VENQPRWESLQWYASTIGFSLDDALQVIAAMPRLWEQRPEGRERTRESQARAADGLVGS
jgi:hypothetical protein